MTRFWITIEEAIELTRFAATNGVTNEIFVPKMQSLEMQEVANRPTSIKNFKLFFLCFFIMSE